ncbi:MAG: hypothetical protein QW505_06675 [Thermoplasmata archaeon]
MSHSRGDARRRITSILVLMLLLVPSVQLFSSRGQAEIPHENYDLIKSDLDVVIRLLNSSIRASERAFMDMYNESMDAVDQDLRVVVGILEPAGALLDKIVNLAESYKNLSALLPPFVALSEQEQKFASYEREFLSVRALLIAYIDSKNLTGENLTAATREVARGRALIERMNSTIDEMLIHATEINELIVGDSHPFLPNDMIPLIEKLRELLLLFSIEFEDIVHNRIPWEEALPFLILWVKDTSLYLGETIVGGGYLFFNGSFRAGRAVEIRIDNNISIYATTFSGGQYGFRFDIPVNVSWLGLHTVQSFAFTGWENLSSNVITIRVSLIPTTLRLSVDRTLLTLDDDLTIKASLKDVYGRGVETANCTLRRDALETNFSTDGKGSFSIVWESSEIGLGTHTISARFLGMLPFAPCDSNVVRITVNIPTRMNLTLFEDRYIMGYSILGNGTLYANRSEPLGGQIVTLSIDGKRVANVTTRDDGSFAFGLSTTELNLTVGTHTLVAAFIYRDSMYRYCQAEAKFTIIVRQAILPYPFFPFIPGWGGVGGLGDLINLFFGEYAYLTWLLILIILIIIIRSWQLRKKRRALAAAEAEKIFEPTAEQVAAAQAASEAEPESERKPPEDPNGRIVWYYNYLLRTLTRKRMISILDSMTHWEVARLLRSLGYPLREVDSVTILFEMAFYSGTTLSDEDARTMASNIERIEAAGTGGAPSAG